MYSNCMVRTARFTAEIFVEAAIALVAEDGPSAATMAALARRVGAPTGSIYHRFDSRSAVLAAAWGRVHGAFSARVIPPLAAGRALDAALAIAGWARADRQGGRFLLLNEGEALFDEAVPALVLDDLRRRQEALDTAFRACVTILAGGEDVSAEVASRARFLIFDGPIAAIRPHLLSGDTVPADVDRMIAEMHQSIRIAPPRPLPQTADGQAA